MLSLMKLIPLDEIASAVNAVLPASSTDAMRKSVQVAVLSTIRKMNLVSRDEVEELEKALLQLRERIEALEELVAKPNNLNLTWLNLSKMKAGLSRQIHESSSGKVSKTPA